MLRRKQEKNVLIPEHVDTAICVEAFRPAPISRMIEVGDSVRLDDEIVTRNPAHFAVRLNDLLEKVK